jgi:isoquinoline 1-oxidoreductase beta subunit
MNRRVFIKTSLTVVGSLMVKFSVQAEEKLPLTKSEKPVFNPMGFIEITSNNVVKFQLTKIEMGQGVGTSYLTIIGEELDVSPSNIMLISPQYNNQTQEIYHKINAAITGGSSSVRAGWKPLREAAATTRQLLLQAAANYWRLSVEQCFCDNGSVKNKINNAVFNFGDLTEAAATLPMPEQLKLKDQSQFRFIGKRQKSYMHHNIVTGQQQYGIDIFLKNMKYASIKHCPTITGTVTSFNEKEIRALNGVVDVLIIPRKQLIQHAKKGDPLDDASIREGIAIIATSTWAALNAVKKLNIVWRHTIDKYSNKTLEEKCLGMLNTVGKVLNTHGVPSEQFNNAHDVMESVYQCPYVSHHYMEPLNAIAHVQGKNCEIWAGTQSPSRDRFAISNALNLNQENININVQATGGAFGRKFNPDFTLEAAYLSQKIGCPVKSLWSREEEISCGQQSDYEIQKFSVALDKQNRITGYQWQSVISGKWVSEINLYLIHIPHFLLSFQRRDKTLNLAPWRAVQTARTNLGVECFIDELAHRGKQDPIQYRLSLLEHPVLLPGLSKDEEWILDFSTKYRARYQTLLKYLQSNSDLQSSEEPGRGKGIAVGNYGGSTIVQVADITVIGSICKINKITSIVSCGIVIDLSGAEQQISGSIIWTLNALFMPSTQFDSSQVTQTNFNDSPLIRMPQIPTLETTFIDSEEAPTGLGEPAVCSLAPAILNALFSATGKRVRTRQLADFTLK